MDWITPATVAVSIITAVWSLAMWLSKQFAAIRTLVFEQGERIRDQILKKLEYHERHDDERFHDIKEELDNRIQNLRNDVWEIRIRNAAKDGLLKPQKKTDE